VSGHHHIDLFAVDHAPHETLPARAPLPRQAIAQPLPEQAGLAAACCSSIDISSVSNFHDVDDSVLMVYGIDHSIVALPQAIDG
jgi:hypothetical protein